MLLLPLPQRLRKWNHKNINSIRDNISSVYSLTKIEYATNVSVAMVIPISGRETEIYLRSTLADIEHYKLSTPLPNGFTGLTSLQRKETRLSISRSSVIKEPDPQERKIFSNAFFVRFLELKMEHNNVLLPCRMRQNVGFPLELGNMGKHGFVLVKPSLNYKYGL